MLFLRFEVTRIWRDYCTVNTHKQAHCLAQFPTIFLLVMRNLTHKIISPSSSETTICLHLIAGSQHPLNPLLGSFSLQISQQNFLSLLKSFSRPNFSVTFPWDMKATNWQREGEKMTSDRPQIQREKKKKLDPSGKKVIITAKILPQIPWSSFRSEWNHREEEEEWRGDTITPCSTRCHGRSQSPTEERRRDPQESSQWQTWCYRNSSWSAALPMPWLLHSTPSLPSFLSSFLMQKNTKTDFQLGDSSSSSFKRRAWVVIISISSVWQELSKRFGASRSARPLGDPARLSNPVNMVGSKP